MIEDGPEEDREPEAPLSSTAPENASEASPAPDSQHDLPAAALLDPPEAPPASPEEPSPHQPPAAEERLLPPTPSEAPPPPLQPEIPPVQRKRGGVWRTLGRVVGLLLIAVLIAPPAGVIAYRFIPPPITWLMVERLAQGQGLTRHWTPLSDIDPSLPNAVIAGEDANFCEHHGFDFAAMQAAIRANARHPGKLRGGSTISQQVAKNVFLWPSRDYLRKGLEAYYTVLIEALWGKRRIMEMYLNEVEWGPGTYGAQAAAQRYFNEPASDIDPGEASRLAAILPSPLKWKAVNPGRYVQKRSRRIDAAAGTVRDDGLAGCLRW